jgi:uridine kinase
MLIIGVAGGSGSGKTTFADLLVEDLAQDQVLILRQDSYYRPFADFSVEERRDVNFDHPMSIDFEQLIDDVRRLRAGQSISVPLYDFEKCTRVGFQSPCPTPRVLIVEGILIFAEPKLRELLDIKLFIDADDDDRLIRRLHRDVASRGRDVEAVIRQYQKTVKPMHLEFVEPSKRWADLIIPQGGRNGVGLELIRMRIEPQLRSMLERG